jgi:hypothetical protein
MKNLNLISLIVAFLTLITGTIMAMYNIEFKIWLSSHYPLLVIEIGLLAASLVLISKWVVWTFRDEKKKLESEISTLKAWHKEQVVLNKKLITSEELFSDMNEFYINTSSISHAITLDIINNADNPEQMAKILYSYYETRGLTIPQWEDYKINSSIIVELKKLYYSGKLEKLNQLNTNKTLTP